MELILIALLTHEMFGISYRALAINAAYLTMPIMGQVIWAAWNRYIRVYAAALFMLGAWGLFVWSTHLDIHPEYIPRPFPLAVAVALFLLGLFAEDRLVQRKAWVELSDRTYSIYLLHGVVAFPVLHLTFDILPAGVSVLLAVLATAATVEVGYRLVERPSHQLGRWLSRGHEPSVRKKHKLDTTAGELERSNARTQETVTESVEAEAATSEHV